MQILEPFTSELLKKKIRKNRALRKAMGKGLSRVMGYSDITK